MSLHQVLNSAQTAVQKPAQPLVRRVLTKKIENVPKQVQSINPPQAPNIVVKKQTPSFPAEEEMIVFSLMAKLLLPKDRHEKINISFQKLLLNKISFVTVSKVVSANAEICPVLLKTWQNIINRNVMSGLNQPLYNKLYEIVVWFKQKGISNAVTCNFVSAISTAKQLSTPSFFIFDRLISKFEVLDSLKSSGKLMQFSLDLLKLLPKSSHPLNSTIQKVKERPSFYEILSANYNDKEFSVYPHYNDISTFMMRNGKMKEHPIHRHVSARDTTFTPSHHLHLTPILDKQPAFFLNYFTKSLNSGHEGGSRGHDSRHTEIPLPNTRDIHDVLEQPEIHEHEMDAILSFDQDTNFVGHIVTVAIQATYDTATYENIFRKINSYGVRKHVSEQCRKRLPLVLDAHSDACNLCNVFLFTRPINAFLLTLRIPEVVDGISFSYFNTDEKVSEYAKSVFNLYTSPRYPYLPFFFRNVSPVLSRGQEYMTLIGPKASVMALYYYSKLCEALLPLISKMPSEFQTYEASFDIACEQVQEKYPDGESALPHRFLSKVLKSITKNGTIMDDMSFEIYKHFGPQSIYVSQIAPILSQFNAACHCLSADPHWEEMREMTALFATANDVETLDVRFPLYSQGMMFPSGGKMYLLKSVPGESRITVSIL